jgi:hypothetical protein
MTAYHYILVWGHGMPHLDGILDAIRSAERCTIRKLLVRRVRSVRRLVKQVYSMDYAPFHHLKAKTRYLMKTPPMVAVVFVEIDQPKVEYFGEGAFRHQESLEIRELKESIRDRFNPRRGGQRSEDHVVHAADNEQQTDHMLRLLGFAEGVGLFRARQAILDVPYYIGACERFELREVPLARLSCNVLQGDRERFSLRCLPLFESPHYLGLTGDMQIYDDYVRRFRGGPLTEDYSVQRFTLLASELDYLAAPDDNCYIVTKPMGDRLVIQDGLHRAAIMLSRGYQYIPVAVL